MSSNFALRIQNLSKCYNIYTHPQDRLKQAVFPKLKKISKLFSEKKYYKEFWAVRDISFELQKGERIGIIGKNGSGKSTLLQLISGILQPTTGIIERNGRIVALLELGSGFNPEFTGRDNVFHYGAVLGIPRSYIEDKFDEIAVFADIGDFMNRPMKTYSSGMRMRLAFSVATHIEPDILIIDEALSVGDAFFAFKCLNKIDELITKLGTTLLFVSHDTGMVKRFCNRAIYLKEGEIIHIGSVQDVVELYYLNIWDKQHNGIGQSSVKLKQSLSNNITFGCEDGRFISAKFSKSETLQASFKKDEVMEFDTVIEWSDSLKDPILSIIINDSRMMELGGRSFSISSRKKENSNFIVSVRCSLKAIFFRGKYSITLRLEGKNSSGETILIEKQVAILLFEIVAGEFLRIGPSEFDILCKEN